MSFQRSEEDLTANDLPELSHWERILSSFDTENVNEPNPSDTTGSSMPQAGSEDALLAQLAASNMFPSSLHPSYAPQRQLHPSEFNPGPGQSNQRPFAPPANLASSSYDSHATYPSFQGGPPSPTQNRTYSAPSPTEATRGRTRAPRASHTQAGPSTSTTSPDGGEDTDEYEDKRRRNTAASARFRIKKKQRTLDLERSVSDLTGRAEDLEREASDLRRENGWLKEIIMLKGGHLAGINLSGNTGYSETAGRGSERRDKRRDSMDEDESDSDRSNEDRAEGSGSGSKSKGKAKSKKK
ncbi:hypothetical protein FB451DRAFT_610302 [Mycena latifolia]|nr:hypothetical protein FB451DRAFT_610302 [Mycena latifolia]